MWVSSRKQKLFTLLKCNDRATGFKASKRGVGDGRGREGGGRKEGGQRKKQKILRERRRKGDKRKGR